MAGTLRAAPSVLARDGPLRGSGNGGTPDFLRAVGPGGVSRARTRGTVDHATDRAGRLLCDPLCDALRGGFHLAGRRGTGNHYDPHGHPCVQVLRDQILIFTFLALSAFLVYFDSGRLTNRVPAFLEKWHPDQVDL